MMQQLLSSHRSEILGLMEVEVVKMPLIKAAMGLHLVGRPGNQSDASDIWDRIFWIFQKEKEKNQDSGIGMVLLDAGASLCPIRTIGDQIYESMRAHKKVSRNEAKDRAMELFEKLNFKDSQRVWDSYPFELSGGMNQRAGIAISMLMNPPILLADEPTSALDVSVQRQVVREMLRLRELFGTAIIIVTHDIGVVRAMADTVLVLKNGKMVEYGEAKKVLNHPQDPYTKKLLAAVPRLKRKERS
ncbi:MAG: ATP-binding cassette domain-containing protein [Ruminococcus sp.]